MPKVFISYSKVLSISVFTYLLFFYPLLNPHTTIYSGKDSVNFHYPSRYYLYESLKSGRFPFWTERIFSGFPIYADLERAYLSPLNLLSVYVLGPINSYKLMHFSFYLLGSLSLFALLKRKGISVLGFATANVIYFFSFFNLYHQQHFQMTLTAYLLPTALLLVDLFLASRKFLYFFLNVLLFVNLIYLGNLQTVFLLLITTFCYFCTFAFRNLPVNTFVKYWVLFAGWFVILCLPILLPAYDLFSVSFRQGNGVSYTEGSFVPLLFTAVGYPYLFGSGSTYEGVIINPEYFMHETYIYVGITSLVAALLGFLVISNKRFALFLSSLILVFLFLGFVRYIPFFNTNLLFPFSIFRYWGRSSLLFTFAVACFAAEFISCLSGSLSLLAARLKFLFLLPAYLLILQLFNLRDSTSIALVTYIAKRFNFDNNFLLWLLLFVLVIVAVFFSQKSVHKRLSSFLVVFLVFTDIFIFGYTSLATAFTSTDSLYEKLEIPVRFANRRIFVPDGRIFANNGLYYESWNLFGYSQFAPANYVAYLKSFGFAKEKGPELLMTPYYPNFTKSLERLGVFRRLVEGAGSVELVEVSEGYLKMRISTDVATNVQTYLRNFTGWELYVDSIAMPFSNNNDAVYLSFDLAAGEHLVVLQYAPKRFYEGLLYLIILGSGLFALSLRKGWLLQKNI